MTERLRFDVDDEDAFHQARDTLLEEMEAWASRPASGVDAVVVVDAGLFLDWRWGYSSGELDRFDPLDVEEYLIDWCPRKLSASPEHWPDVVAGVQAYVLFLAANGRWAGGSVQPLLRHIERLTPRFLQEMGDPANYGLAKGLFAGVSASGLGEVDPDDPSSLAAVMDAFNSLPIEERTRLTDPFVGGSLGEDPPEVDLPMTPGADEERAVAEAGTAPIILQLEAVREHLGAGKPLTAKGNPKVVDARAMVTMFEIDDGFDREVGGRRQELRSADDVPHLLYLIDVAVEAKALRRYGGRLVPVKAWAKRDPLDKVRAALEAMIANGPLVGRHYYTFQEQADFDEVCETGLPHWLAPVFLAGTYGFDDLVQVVDETAGPMLPRMLYHRSAEDRRETLADRMAEALDVVERCGLVTRTGTSTEVEAPSGRGRRRGGTLRITELGRLLLPEVLATAGYRVHTAAELASVSAAELLTIVGEDVGIEPDEVWAAWRPGDSYADKVAAIVVALGEAAGAGERLRALTLLAEVPELAEPMLRDLEDGPLEGHVTMFLAEHGFVDESEVMALPPEKALAPLVDILASVLDDGPETLVDSFHQAFPADDAADVVGHLARVPMAEAGEVLNVLGRHHPDKAVAKAARKAALQHRSRMANR